METNKRYWDIPTASYNVTSRLVFLVALVLPMIVAAVIAVIVFAPTTYASSHQFSQLHWSEEFNGTSVDTTRWKVYYSNYGEGPGCNTPQNVSVGGGMMQIVVRKETMVCPGGKTTTYTGGFLGSREVNRYYPLYGKYEMRARLSHGQGIWPSFWLRRIGGASHAEVDIFELFHNSGPGKITQSLHFPKSIGKGALKSGTYFENVTRAGTGGWHTFGVTISPVRPGDNSAVRFQFFVDGNMTKEYINYQSSAWTNVNPETGWDIAISMNGGGDWVGLPDKHLGYITARGGLCAKDFRPPPGGNPDACPTTSISRPGDRIFLTNFAETSYSVDWVRVYRFTPDGSSAPAPQFPPDATGSGPTSPTSPIPSNPAIPPPSDPGPLPVLVGPSPSPAPPKPDCVTTAFQWNETNCVGSRDDSGGMGNPIIIAAIDFLKIGSALVGILIVAGVIWGGIMYAGSKGNPAATKKAVGIIGKALLALVLFGLMFAAINFLIPGSILTR